MVKTKIVEIGSMVPAFEEERLIILFGPKATAELRDISVIHEVQEQPKKFNSSRWQIESRRKSVYYRRSWISGESEF